MTKKQIMKMLHGACYFCGDSNYDVLDSHRIVPGANNGKYIPENTVVVCCKCHRLIHAGKITIDKKYLWSGPGFVVHYWENGKEFWRAETLRKNVV